MIPVGIQRQVCRGAPLTQQQRRRSSCTIDRFFKDFDGHNGENSIEYNKKIIQNKVCVVSTHECSITVIFTGYKTMTKNYDFSSGLFRKKEFWSPRHNEETTIKKIRRYNEVLTCSKPKSVMVGVPNIVFHFTCSSRDKYKNRNH